MALTRAAARARLAATFAELLSEAGVVDADVDGGLKEPIDDALRDLGVAEADLGDDIADADIRGFLALARYYVLARVYDAVLWRVDASIALPSQSKSRSQFPKELREAIKDAKAAAMAYGLSAANSWQAAGALSTDYLEPAAEEVA